MRAAAKKPNSTDGEEEEKEPNLVFPFPGVVDITPPAPVENETEAKGTPQEIALREAEYTDIVRLSWNDDNKSGEVILEAALDAAGDLTWIELRQDPIIAHLNRKKWIAAMINDIDRARAYESALVKVRDTIENSQEYIVADLGAGSGLLTQLALRTLPSGIHCVSVEMERCMAELIPQDDTALSIVPARSTEIEVPERAKLILSELVDHFLVGEGVIPTSRDAATRLLADGGIQIPKAAHVYCAIIQCATMRRGPPPTRVHIPENTKMQDVHSFEDDDIEMLGALLNDDNTSEAAIDTKSGHIFTWYRKECRGGVSVESRRIAALQATSPDFEWLSEPVHIAKFDLTQTEETFHVFLTTLPVSKTGEADAIVYWWTLELFEDIQITSSPFVHQQQDHWHQAVQPLPQPIPVRQTETLSVHAQLNDAESQLQLLLLKSFGPPPQVDAHWCNCGWHSWPCPKRCRALPADPFHLYTSRLQPLLSALPNQNATVLDIGDTAIFTLITGFYHRKTGLQFRAALDASEDALLASQIAAANGIENTVHITARDFDTEDNTEAAQHETPALVWADPYFHKLRGNPIATLVRLARRFQSSGASISFPASARIVCAPLRSPRLRRAYGAIDPMILGCDQSKLAEAWSQTCMTSLFRLALHDYLDDLEPAAEEVTALNISSLLHTQPEAWASLALDLTLFVPADLIAVYVTYDDLGGPLSAVSADDVLVKFLWPHQHNDASTPLNYRLLVAADASCTLTILPSPSR